MKAARKTVPLPDPAPRPPHLPGFVTYFGVPVAVVDGTPVAVGHIANHRAVLFAFNRHAEQDLGRPAYVETPKDEDTPGLLQRSWAVHEDDRLQWPVPDGQDGAFPITVFVGRQS